MDLFLDGLGFGESPRWRDSRLWFSDFILEHVASVGLDGDLRIEAELLDRPSGLGWLPDGRLLIVSMRRRMLYRREHDGRLLLHADLGGVAGFDANDMVVAADGTAYVGNLGSDLLAGAELREAPLAIVHPDGRVEEADEGLLVPNGSVITPEGDMLIVGETLGRRFTAFPIKADGSLGASWVWADLGERSTDGCTLDSEGAIWFADGNGVARVLQGGRITDVIEAPEPAYACALGGENGKTLFTLTSPGHPTRDFRPGQAHIWKVEVDYAHAGRP